MKNTIWINEDLFNKDERLYLVTLVGKENVIYEMVDRKTLKSDGEVCSSIHDFKKNKITLSEKLAKENDIEDWKTVDAKQGLSS